MNELEVVRLIKALLILVEEQTRYIEENLDRQRKSYETSQGKLLAMAGRVKELAEAASELCTKKGMN